MVFWFFVWAALALFSTEKENVAASLYYANSFLVKLAHGIDPEAFALNAGYLFLGSMQLNGEDLYYFSYAGDCLPSIEKNCNNNGATREESGPSLDEHEEVEWVIQQPLLERSHRFATSDPGYSSAWYFDSPYALNMNISSAWNQKLSGRGVSICIVDDGVEHSNPELSENYFSQGSFDFNEVDADPTPRYDTSNTNRHGTRCAGTAAAIANNSLCSIGVAYRSSLSGIRMLDGDVTDIVEGSSLSYKPDLNYIYSSSWGPSDDGMTLEGPGLVAKAALRNGVENGRHGLGSIYMWAAGNGGSSDNCNCDGYANSIFTIAMGSFEKNGKVPSFAEPCSAMLGVMPSGGIATSDLHSGCASSFSGTSASCPFSAGVVALVLEANPCLTWRDVQHLMIISSSLDGLVPSMYNTVTNGAGLRFNLHFGFGYLNAASFVRNAKGFISLSNQIQLNYSAMPLEVEMGSSIISRLNISGCQENSSLCIDNLEHVTIDIKLGMIRRGNLEISLTSPSGTKSVLLTRRSSDSTTLPLSWTLMSLHFWKEAPLGVWLLQVSPLGGAASNILQSWTLTIYGTMSSSRYESDLSIDYSPMTLSSFPTLSTSQSQSCYVCADDWFPDGLGGCYKCDASCDTGCVGPYATGCRSAQATFTPPTWKSSSSSSSSPSVQVIVAIIIGVCAAIFVVVAVVITLRSKSKQKFQTNTPSATSSSNDPNTFFLPSHTSAPIPETMSQLTFMQSPQPVGERDGYA